MIQSVAFSNLSRANCGMRNSGIGYKGATSYILTTGTPFCAKFKDASQAKQIQFPYTAFPLHFVMAVFENRQKRYGNTIRSCGKCGRYCTSVVVASFRLSVSSSSRKRLGARTLSLFSLISFLQVLCIF